MAELSDLGVQVLNGFVFVRDRERLEVGDQRGEEIEDGLDDGGHAELS